jgi:hypothetical protein
MDCKESESACDTAKRSKAQLHELVSKAGKTSFCVAVSHCTGWRAQDEDASVIEVRTDSLPGTVFVSSAFVICVCCCASSSLGQHFSLCRPSFSCRP